MTERLAGWSRRASTLIIYFPIGFLIVVVKEFVENLNEIFFVLFKEKRSFPEDMVSIRALEMCIQGEQPILAKLKIIIMGHRGVAGYRGFFCPIIKVRREELKIYSKFFMYIWNKKLLWKKNRSCLPSQCRYQTTEPYYLIWIIL